MAKAKRTTAKRKRTTPTKRRSQSVRRIKRNSGSQMASRYALPLLISLLLLAGITFFGYMGYQTATKSGFFAVKDVDVQGTNRVSADVVTRIVNNGTEKTGVWNADLPTIRERIEKIEFVKSASVSMKLPYGIRVNLIEREPVAIVKLSRGDFLIDSDGIMLAPVTKAEPEIPFALVGWDEEKSDRSLPDNLARLKLYKKMVAEWEDLGVAERVKFVNLADLRDPKAVIEESGHQIGVTLAKNELGRSLRSAVEAVAGKGAKIKAVNAGGISPIIEYLGN